MTLFIVGWFIGMLTTLVGVLAYALVSSSKSPKLLPPPPTLRQSIRNGDVEVSRRERRQMRPDSFETSLPPGR